MPFLKQLSASSLIITPCLVKNKEDRGFYFILPGHWERSEAMGAQCAECQTILWITGRWHPILNKDMSGLRGEEYREAYKQNIEDFLSSLPKCPECGLQVYDIYLLTIMVWLV